MKSFLILAAVLAHPFFATAVPIERRAPPNVPTGAEAQSMLQQLTVAVQGTQDGYSRKLFPHWIHIDGACNTRQEVLIRDGTGIAKDAACHITTGSWDSPYDGASWTSTHDIQIDHLVPLSNAWKSGAAAWTTEQRQAFANDLTNPQLVAVTGRVNEAKSDSGPEDWQPPLTSYHCQYASMWVKVKSVYSLTVDQRESDALAQMLQTCTA